VRKGLQAQREWREQGWAWEARVIEQAQMDWTSRQGLVDYMGVGVAGLVDRELLGMVAAPSAGQRQEGPSVDDVGARAVRSPEIGLEPLEGHAHQYRVAKERWKGTVEHSALVLKSVWMHW
jgi:hypothetical protein